MWPGASLRRYRYSGAMRAARRYKRRRRCSGVASSRVTDTNVNFFVSGTTTRRNVCRHDWTARDVSVFSYRRETSTAPPLLGNQHTPWSRPVSVPKWTYVRLKYAFVRRRNFRKISPIRGTSAPFVYAASRMTKHHAPAAIIVAGASADAMELNAKTTSFLRTVSVRWSAN